MPRKRDYAAEYARRIAKGKERGLTKAVARGHAPRGVIGIQRARTLNIPAGFVIGGRHGKGFKATAKSRRDNIRNVGVKPTEMRISEIVTNQEKFVGLLKDAGFTEREAFTLWFS